MIGATIISEFGDIKSFATPAKFVAFAGLDSRIDQSAASHDSTAKMTKRGSPYLRTALGAVARKLCYTVHAILYKNSPYEILP